MPNIRISDKTKARLEKLMVQEARTTYDRADDTLRTRIFIKICRSQYGFTFDDFINLLMDKYGK